MTTSIRASVPPWIDHRRWAADPGTRALLDRSAAALRALDVHHGAGLAPLTLVLGRTDAVASSRIEDESASVDDVARALVGSRANTGAIAVVRAADAIERLVSAADSGVVTEGALLDAHRLLMRDDPLDRRSAGRYRDVQNWIGGGDSPATALYVPPPPALVGPLMADLFAFLDRTDLDPIAQAAIGHAQFESIHPFTDGNGRIGRALIGAVLRRRCVTTTVTAPVAVALAAERSRYFGHLEAFRDGHVDAFVVDLALAVGTVCDEATVTALLLDECAAGMDVAAAPHRAIGRALAPHRVAGRAIVADPLLVVGRALVADPLLTEDRLEALVGAGQVDAVAADLVRTGVLRAVTERRRDRAWVAPAVVAELEAFEERVRAVVGARARDCGMVRGRGLRVGTWAGE